MWFSVAGFEEDGFSGFLDQSLEFRPNWTEVRTWKMTGAGSGFFDYTTHHFPPKFVAQNEGIYYVSGNFWISGANTSLVKVKMAVNSGFEEPNGLTARFGSATGNGTATLSGILLLHERDVMSVAISGFEGELLRFSTFSVLRLAKMGTVPGFHATLSKKMSSFSTGGHLEDWRISFAKGSFAALTGFSPATGKFCAICDGIYKYASNVNFQYVEEGRKSTISLVLNGQKELLRYYASGLERHTGNIDGLVRLREGNCIELRVYSQSDVTEDSSFSVLYLGAEHSNIPAFSASLRNSSQIEHKPGWQLVRGWNVSSEGFFGSSLGTFGSEATFSAVQTGFYLISVVLNFELEGNIDTSQIFCQVTAAQTPQLGNGFQASKTVSAGNTSITIHGVLSLDRDEIKVYVRHQGTAIIARDFSGSFSAILITQDYAGFAATLSKDKQIQVSDWTRLTGWETSEGIGFFPLRNSSLTTTGCYQVFHAGTYFVSSSIIMNGTEKASLEALISIDEEVDSQKGLYSYEESFKGNTTLNVMGTVKLREGQNVSVSVRVRESTTWTIRNLSSFYIALVGGGRIQLDGVPGFLAGEHFYGPDLCNYTYVALRIEIGARKVRRLGRRRMRW